MKQGELVQSTRLLARVELGPDGIELTLHPQTAGMGQSSSQYTAVVTAMLAPITEVTSMSAAEIFPIKLTSKRLQKEWVFNSPADILTWENKVRTDWQWLSSTPARAVFDAMATHLNGVRQSTDRWQRSNNHAETQQQAISALERAFQQLYDSENSFIEGPSLELIQQTKRLGEQAAAGVVAALGRGKIDIDGRTEESFFSGLIRGFIYRNNIDWNTTQQKEQLEHLTAKYLQNVEEQNARLHDIARANKELTDKFEAALTEKSAGLDALLQEKREAIEKLTSDKAKEFDQRLQTARDETDELIKNLNKKFEEATTENAKSLKQIEETVKNKLALRQPVEYWKEKHKTHGRLAKIFATWSGVAFGIGAIALGTLIYLTFFRLENDQNPKHWQVGIVVVAAFVIVWIL